MTQKKLQNVDNYLVSCGHVINMLLTCVDNEFLKLDKIYLKTGNFMVVVESLVRSEQIEELKCNYFYRMVKSNVTLTSDEDKIDVQSYGIEIERQDLTEEGIINIERDCIKSISPHRHKVHNLLKLLYDHTVSPLHLIDILGDYIDEYIIDFDEALKEISTY